MSTRRISFALGEFYHVYNRGTDKRVIVKDVADYQRFIELLYLCNSHKAIDHQKVQRSEQSIYDFDRGDQLVSIGAYCLMPNHFHILLSPKNEEGVSTFMNKFGTSYSMYFNKKYERSGGLFEGTFKAEHANTDVYLKYLFSYIHLNPVKLIQSDWKEVGIRDVTTAMKYLESYVYSSFLDYIKGSEREATKILNRDVFPKYFTTGTLFQKEIMEWITFNSKH